MEKHDQRWRTNPDLWEKLKHIAHEKRKKPTEAEKTLWQKLRMHRFHGLKFRSQHCIGPFIVDFYCKQAKVIIEVDGEIHQYRAEEDKIRQEFLENKEYKVLRFPNDVVLNNIDEVLRQIESSLPGTL
jgi:very-short-patch-repair endonuclease